MNCYPGQRRNCSMQSCRGPFRQVPAVPFRAARGHLSSRLLLQGAKTEAVRPKPARARVVLRPCARPGRYLVICTHSAT